MVACYIIAMLCVQTEQGSDVSISMYPNQLLALTAFNSMHEEVRHVPIHSSVVMTFHPFMRSLLKYESTEQHRPWDDPLTQCIALGQVHFDSLFHNPKNGLTRDIAAVEYIAHCWLVCKTCEEATSHAVITSKSIYNMIDSTANVSIVPASHFGYTKIGLNTPITTIWHTSASDVCY